MSFNDMLSKEQQRRQAAAKAGAAKPAPEAEAAPATKEAGKA
jgi:hypothetical protein